VRGEHHDVPRCERLSIVPLFLTLSLHKEFHHRVHKVPLSRVRLMPYLISLFLYDFILPFHLLPG